MSYNPYEEKFHEELMQQGFMLEREEFLDALEFDEGIQMRVCINREKVSEYRDKWLAGVRFPPIDVFYDPEDYAQRIADGIHRYLAAKEAGIKKILIRVFRGTRRDAILHACRSNNQHGFPITDADKRKAVLTLLLDSEWKRRSNSWIAEQCNASEFLVRTVQEELLDAQHGADLRAKLPVSEIGIFDLIEDRPQNSNDFSSSENSSVVVPKIKMAKRNGRIYPMRVNQIGAKAREARNSYHQALPQPSQEKLLCAGCEERFSRDSLQNIDDFLYCEDCAQAARMVRSQARELVGELPPTKKEEREEVEAPTKKQPTIQPSGNDSWCTPPELVRVISQFGDIALDPCSNEFAKTKAALSFTRNDDGLSRDWAHELTQRGIAGLVYVNPPYDSETLEAVAKHCVAQHAKGLEILSLVPCKLDQEWWQSTVFDSVSGVCFVKGRIKFWEEGRPKSGAPMPCAFLYWGARGEAFQSHFSLVGRVFLLDIIRNGGKP